MAQKQKIWPKTPINYPKHQKNGSKRPKMSEYGPEFWNKWMLFLKNPEFWNKWII